MDEIGSGVLPPDPFADLLADDGWRAAHLAWLARVAEERDASIEAVFLDETPADSEVSGMGVSDAGWVPWSVLSGAEHDHAVDRLEALTRQARVAVAAQYGLIAGVLADAAAVPDPWVGPDPTLDPGWVDPRDRSLSSVRRERRDHAVRAAAADVAVRLRVSESTVRTRGFHADTLRERCPKLWAVFTAGGIEERNAITAAQQAGSLPADADDAWAVFDAQLVEVAGVLTPAKFRTRARVVRERVHPESLTDRARRAVEERGVWLTPEFDGMATLSARVPAADAYQAMGRLDASARHLRAQDGETRTLDQLRADAFTDLLTTGTTETTDGKGKGGGGVSVAVTVPVLSLLGKSEEPATLHGYGPIDLDTAKRLAGGASSWVRILTHPVTGTVLDIDRATYRVPKPLRRWVENRHSTCIFPGCGRLARDCDVDHLIDWQYGGTTADPNLAPECEPHHIIKHGTRWDVHRDPDTGEIYWTSPTGRIIPTDPAPF